MNNSFLSIYIFEFYLVTYTVKKVSGFPVPSRDVKLFLARNYCINLFPARENLVSDTPAGDGKTDNLFLQCSPFNMSNLEKLNAQGHVVDDGRVMG
jgi:hypothetical protein